MTHPKSTSSGRKIPYLFAKDPPGSSRYYESIGRVMAMWGFFETHFESDLIQIANVPDAQPLFSPFPRMPKGKLEAWRKAFETVKILGPYKDAASEWADRVEPIAEKRNVVAHGSFHGFCSASPLIAEFVRIKWVGKKPNQQFGLVRYQCSLEEMQEIALAINGLNTSLTAFSLLLD